MDVLKETPMRPMLVLLLALSGCSTTPKAPVRAYHPPPPPNYRHAELPFSDTDAFDAALKTLLNDGTPAIRVALDTDGTDWPDRLVGWLDAYRAGGKVRPEGGKGALAALAWLAAGGGLTDQTRQALEGALDRLDGAVQRAAVLLAAVQDRRERVELLRPYRLTFERDEARGGKFALVLFNGRYGEPGR